jgi:hypothetical protein
MNIVFMNHNKNNKKMKFEEQIQDVELVIVTTPRVHVKWTNTEQGRDKQDCYERFVFGEEIIYKNILGKNTTVKQGQPFFNTLENIHKMALANSKKIKL